MDRVRAAARCAAFLAAPLAAAIWLVPACSDDAAPAPGPPGAPGAHGAPAANAADPRSAALERDRRIQDLLVPLPRNEHYSRDTSDLVPVWIEKLERGFVGPLQRAKEELANAGQAAIPELARAVERSYASPTGYGLLQNSLDALCLSSAPGAHDVLIAALDHPRSSVRRQAAEGLWRKHALPGDYDRLLQQLEFDAPDVEKDLALALYKSDPARAELLYVEWVRANQRTRLWDTILPILFASVNPATAQAAVPLYRGEPALFQACFAALAVRAGDADAHRFLEDEAKSDEPERRLRAIYAFGALGEEAPLVAALTGSPHAAERMTAFSGLRVLPMSPAIRDAFAATIGEREVAELGEAALAALVEIDDPAAIDHAIYLLDDPLDGLRVSLLALKPAWKRDRALAERCLARLLARDAKEAKGTLELRVPALQAIAQVPLREAAAHLRKLAMSLPDAEMVKGLRAHEWLMIQAANTGLEGRTFLLDELASERDPLRRIDLIWAAASERCPAEGECPVRERLLALVEDPATDPLEFLFACDRLIRMGPGAEVAPRLKRACLRIEDARARPALQGMLWNWY